MDNTNRQTWPRVALTLPPEAGAALDELARRNFRDRRREALRLLLGAIEEEVRSVGEPVGAGR
jgi:hypothetical protein